MMMKIVGNYDDSIYFLKFNDFFISNDKELFYISKDFGKRIPFLKKESNNYSIVKINDTLLSINNYGSRNIFIIVPNTLEISEFDGNLTGIPYHLSEKYLLLKLNDSYGICSRNLPFNLLWSKPKKFDTILFSNEKFLFNHNFENKFQINCISLTDGSDLWSRDFTGTYWYDDSVHGLTNSILLSTYNTVSEEICLLSISNLGIVALEAATGKLMWENTKQRFFGIEKFKVFKDKFYQFVCNNDEFNEFYIRVGDIFTGKELQFKRIKDIVADIDRQKNCVFAGKNERFTITEKYVIFDDAEFLFILDRDSLELIDSIKIPFKKGVYYGPRQAPQYQDGYIFHLTYGSKIGSNNLYVFKIED